MRRNGIKQAIMVLFLGIMAVKVYAYDDGDFQVWHTENQEIKLRKNTTLALEEEFRFGDNASEFYYHHYDAGLAYDLNKNFSFKVPEHGLMRTY